ncbi:MAG TPA: glycosyltransferase family 2 protein [Bacteroidales bacterium]|nr:glycosyltransferase family 2 protein [Bacteroidales bacterium]HPO64977.1 glycosyltransferase family 2 protein [Bacteroidales bacterium]
MPKISVVVITYNEERNIERCLQSVLGLADEIVVVDSYSTDGTEEICKRYPVRFIQHPFEGYIEQKNWATAQANYDYVLFLDADEALSETLCESIKQVKEHWTHDGYTFNRLTNYCGRWIRHTSWYPARKLRLYDRRKGCWDGINPHDRFVLSEKSTIRHLEGDLLHYSYYTIEEHLNQINRFTEIIANSYHQKGLHPIFLVHVIFHPLWRFFRDYFVKLGFLDGFYGLVVSVSGAYEVFLKYLKIYHRISIEQKQPPKRLCFLTTSLKWDDFTESFFAYMTGLQQKGIELSLVAPAGSPLLKKARSARMHYFKLQPLQNNVVMRLLTVFRLFNYLKDYRVAAVVVDNSEKEKFILRCAHWAKIPLIALKREDLVEASISPRFKHYYFHYTVDGVSVDSDIKFYTYLMNHYKLVINQEAKNNFVSRSEIERTSVSADKEKTEV